MMRKLLFVLIVIGAFLAGAYVMVYLVDSIKVEKEVIEKREIIGEEAIAPAVAEVYDAVVLVEVRREGSVVNTGTGFFYKTEDDKGFLITNYHVVEPGDEFILVTTDEEEITAEVVGKDIFTDLAVLTVDADEVPKTATLGDGSDMAIGERVFAVGSPLGREYIGTVTKGVLSARNRRVETNLGNQRVLFEVLQTDAAINPGNSGGPLVNQNAEVIGVNSMKIVQDTIEGIGFAIPIGNVMDIIAKLEKGEEIERPFLGVAMVDANDQTALYYHRIALPRTYESGVALVEIEEDSDAAKAGLERMDVVLAVDDEEVKTSAHFRFLLYEYEVGDTITLKIERDLEEKEIEVELKDKLEAE